MTASCVPITRARLAFIASSQSAKKLSGSSATPSRDSNSYTTIFRTAAGEAIARRVCAARQRCLVTSCGEAVAARVDAVRVPTYVHRVSDMRQPRAFYEADSLHTEIYDALAASIIAGSPVAGDVEFYRGLAKETGGPVLEVGCGTGRVAMALAADGHDVVGIDLSVPMVRLAEHR